MKGIAANLAVAKLASTLGFELPSTTTRQVVDPDLPHRGLLVSFDPAHRTLYFVDGGVWWRVFPREHPIPLLIDVKASGPRVTAQVAMDLVRWLLPALFEKGDKASALRAAGGVDQATKQFSEAGEFLWTVHQGRYRDVRTTELRLQEFFEMIVERTNGRVTFPGIGRQAQ